MSILWDWHNPRYSRGEDRLDDLITGRPMASRLGQHWLTRGALLWWMSRRYDVVVTGFNSHATRVLLTIDLVLRRRRYLVLLHFIPDTGRLRAGEGGRTRFDPRVVRSFVKLALLKTLVAPALRRVMLAAHVLTSWEVERNAGVLGIAPGRLYLVPWPLVGVEDEAPPPRERRGVLATGRAACDWPTVFEAAADAEWELTVVCGGRDLPEVTRLNAAGRARVLCDISAEEHRALIQNAEVYLLALREDGLSSGQIRFADAVQAGTPVVAAAVKGLEDYLVDGYNALTFAPGDASGARSLIRRVLTDDSLAAALSSQAFDRAWRWTRQDYGDALWQMVRAAESEARRRHIP